MHRHARLDYLRELLGSGRFASQNALRDELSGRGVEVDQSTLSRDLTELGAVKIDGKYRVSSRVRSAPPDRDLSTAVRGWQACGAHLIVMKTHVGQAQAIGVVLDDSGESALAGTIAGDDTLFLATTSRSKQAIVLRKLKEWFGERP